MPTSSAEPSRQLKEACKLSSARWAVWLKYAQNQWEFGASYGLPKTAQKTLTAYLQDEAQKAWLAGTLSSQRTRWHEVRPGSGPLEGIRLYLFPNAEASRVLLVGAERLEKTGEALFRVVALGATADSATVSKDMPPAAQSDSRMLDFELETSYNPEGGLSNVLEFLANRVLCDAAYLSIRAGDVFRVQATWHCPPGLLGLDHSIHEDEDLHRIVSTYQGAILGAADISQRQKNGRWPLTPFFGSSIQSWMGIPILLGQRIIGQVVFLSHQAGVFSQLDFELVSRQANRLAYAVENAIVFAEAGRYLQRLAMLNELASIASLGVGTDEAARRVIQHLRRTFNTDQAAVYLLSPDNEILHKYTAEAHRETRWQPFTAALPGSVIESGQPVRVGDLPIGRQGEAGQTAVRSTLVVPLKYRGKIGGALALESIQKNAFSLQDEQLLVVIASHLAGLIENIRLNEETRERAAKLQASVRQLQAVRETALDISAALDPETLLRRVVHRARELVDARGAELGLLDEKAEGLRIRVAENPWYDNIGSVIPLMAGVAGRVAAFGEPLSVNDYNQWNGRLYPEQVAPFRAVAAVPLKYPDPSSGKVNVIGTLTVLDDRPGKVFGSEDLQLLELLAPQVAISIRNAQLYQELQERIEAQRLAESRLLRSARLAAVGEMAAGVAHELNNPLTTVSGFVELVLEELDPNLPQRADLELVLREAQRARGVIRRLLDFSRPLEDLRARTDLNEIIRDVLALVHHQMRTHGIEIHLDLEENLPWVRVDPNQIKQVFLNLLHNAQLAMPTGGSITIQTSSIVREGQPWVTAAVNDTGMGIAPENLERIFEPFFTTRPVGSGTGLGLSISYGIITDHGGFIEVTSQVNQGSRFTIYLPINAEEEAEHE